MRSRRLLVAAIAAAALSLVGLSPVLADCGPGPVVTSNKKGIVLQSLGATTNAIFLPTQTMAITSGTSGCSNSGVVKSEYEQEIFVAVDAANVSQDAAQGGGPHLASFAALLGCGPEAWPTFVEWSRVQVEGLFQAGERPREALAELKAGLRQHPVLRACGRLS